MHKPARKSKSLVAWIRHHVQTARTAVLSLHQRMPQPVKRALRRTTHWTLHSTLGVVISVVLIFVAAHLWLPTLADRKEEIETYISVTLGQPVTLEHAGHLLGWSQSRCARARDYVCILRTPACRRCNSRNCA